jgi:hypothetical protein
MKQSTITLLPGTIKTIKITVCSACGHSQDVDQTYANDWPNACAAWMDQIYLSQDHTLNCPDFDNQDQ